MWMENYIRISPIRPEEIQNASRSAETYKELILHVETWDDFRRDNLTCEISIEFYRTRGTAKLQDPLCDFSTFHYQREKIMIQNRNIFTHNILNDQQSHHHEKKHQKSKKSSLRPLSYNFQLQSNLSVALNTNVHVSCIHLWKGEERALTFVNELIDRISKQLNNDNCSILPFRTPKPNLCKHIWKYSTRYQPTIFRTIRTQRSYVKKITSKTSKFTTKIPPFDTTANLKNVPTGGGGGVVRITS